MNVQQLESASKYLYDVSKGAILAGLAGLAMGKLSVGWFVMMVGFTTITYFAAFQLEELDQ